METVSRIGGARTWTHEPWRSSNIGALSRASFLFQSLDNSAGLPPRLPNSVKALPSATMPWTEELNPNSESCLTMSPLRSSSRIENSQSSAPSSPQRLEAVSVVRHHPQIQPSRSVKAVCAVLQGADVDQQGGIATRQPTQTPHNPSKRSHARNGATACATSAANSSCKESLPRGMQILRIPEIAASASISARDRGGVWSP